MKMPTTDPRKLAIFSDGQTPQGKPTFSGFTMEQLAPSSNTQTIGQIIHRLQRPDLKEIVRSLPRRGSKVLRHKYEVLDIDTLEVDQGAYQRLQNETAIADMLSDFLVEACHPPIVCRRLYNGSSNVVTDGQQHVIAARLFGVTRIGCIVYEVHSVKEEARIFGESNDTTSVPTPTKHKNLVLLGDPASLALEGAVRLAGMKVGEKAGNRIVKGTTRLHAIATMYRDENGDPNYSLVSKALEAYATIWPSHSSVHLYLLAGLAHLIFVYTEYQGHPKGHKNLEKLSAAKLALIAKTYPDPIKMVKKLAQERKAEQHRLQSDAYYAGELYTAYNRSTSGSGSLKSGILGKALALMQAK